MNLSMFEILMLFCFGAAWPISIYKGMKSKSVEGKSVLFCYVIFAGYIFGTIHKLRHHFDPVIYLYMLNGIMVLIDLTIYYKNKYNTLLTYKQQKKQSAKKNFHNKCDSPRLNCYQAVLKTFQKEAKINDQEITDGSAYGSGQAPDGMCGALYAAVTLLKKQNREADIPKLEAYFNTNAGSLKCKEIRKLKKLSCVGCVEAATDFLSTIIRP